MAVQFQAKAFTRREGGVAPDEGQTVCDFLQRHAFAESGATTAVFRHDPTCKNGVQKRPQAFLYPEI